MGLGPQLLFQIALDCTDKANIVRDVASGGCGFVRIENVMLKCD